MTYLQDAVWSQFQAHVSVPPPLPGHRQGGGCQGGAGGCRQLGARWTGHRKSWVLHTPPPPMCTHTQTCPCVQRYSRLCRDVDPNVWARCIATCVHVCTTCVHVCTTRGCLKVPPQECKTQPLASRPRLSLCGWLVGQDWPEWYPTHPLAWAVPAGAQYQGPHCSRIQLP